MTERPGGRWPGSKELVRPKLLPPDPRVHPAVKKFYDEVIRRDEYMVQVARRAGYHREQVRLWLKGEVSPRVDDLEALLNTVGLRITVEEAEP